jgi:hypothetical protein
VGLSTRVYPRFTQGTKLTYVEPPQTNAVEPQGGLEMSKQHLDLLPLVARGLELWRTGKLSSPITSLFMDAAQYVAESVFGQHRALSSYVWQSFWQGTIFTDAVMSAVRSRVQRCVSRLYSC